MDPLHENNIQLKYAEGKYKEYHDWITVPIFPQLGAYDPVKV